MVDQRVKKLLGVDIGGTKCAVIDGRYDGNKLKVADRAVFATGKYPEPERALNKIAFMMETMIGEHAGEYAGIGISCGGPLDSKAGCILSPPNLPGWDYVEIVSYFQEKFRIPVYLQNDANAGALAEWKFGAGQGLSDMIFLTCGTGMGAGLILNGRLYAGKKDMAGEAGHIRLEDFGPVGYGKAGSFEGFCSGGGIAYLAQMKLEEYRQKGKKHPLMETDVTAEKVFRFAREEDRLCGEIVEITGQYLGKGMAVMIDMLNPEAIIGGSIFTRNYDLLLPSVKQVIGRECIPAAAESCQILPAMLSEAIGDFAALTTALGLE